jgi:hypothetical protein
MMKINSKFLVIVLMVFVLTLQSTVVAEAAKISVSINGKNISFDQSPIIENGRTLVPLRGVFEELGAVLHWESNKKLITITQNDKKILLNIGAKEAIVNGKKMTMDVPAQIKNSRTLVPLRFITEAMGAKVDWNSSSRSVGITIATDKKQPVQTPKTPPVKEGNLEQTPKIPPVQKENPDKGGVDNGTPSQSPKTLDITEIESNYLPKFNSLASDAESQINSLVSEAATEYNAAKNTDKPVSLSELLNKFLKKATAAEAEIDNRFQTLYSELQGELIKNNISSNALEGIKVEYEAQKTSIYNKLLSEFNF